jgi:cytochrome c-type biogenesis protein
VIHVVDELLNAVAGGSPIAPAIAFGVGIVTSAGPCLGPRLASLAGLAANARGAHRVRIVTAFVGGLCLSYTLIAASSALFSRVTALSMWVYAALAALLAWNGLRTLIVGERACVHGATGAGSCGSAFVSGASFAFVASPCCTPIVASVAGIAGLNDAHWFGLGVAAAFALGHAVPVILASLGAAGARVVGLSHAWRLPLSVVGGGVMLALGGYYALLA